MSKQLQSRPVRSVSAPAPKSSDKEPRPPVPIPTNVDELMALSKGDVESLCVDLALQRAQLQKRRSELLGQGETGAAGAINGMIQSNGILLGVLDQRRGYLRRVEARKVGDENHLEKAFYVVATECIHPKQYNKLIQRSVETLKRWTKDLPSEDELRSRIEQAMKDVAAKQVEAVTKKEGQ